MGLSNEVILLHLIPTELSVQITPDPNPVAAKSKRFFNGSIG
jgi:hypothetical protein